MRVERTMLLRIFLIGWATLWTFDARGAAGDQAASDAAATLVDRYGFQPTEIYKLDPRIRNLLVRDVDADGRMDLLIVNNASNRIDLLMQRGPDDKPTPDDPNEVNEIPSDARMKHRKLPIERTIESLEVADVDGDGKPDLVYLGSPSGLYVQYQDAAGNFTRKQEISVADALSGTWMLDVGDLNGDRKTDIAFLGKEFLYIVFQRANGRLEDPRRYRTTEAGTGLIRVLDFDEDGRNDIVYMVQDDPFPVRIRFQVSGGVLGPERRLKIDRPRGISYANLDGRPGQEMLAISDLSDRLHIYGLREAKGIEESPTSQMVIYPFEKSGASNKGDLAVEDFDGDGKIDVLTSDSDGARLLLYRQITSDGLDGGASYPGMSGLSSIRAARWEAGGPAWAVCLSESERSIGVTRFDGNRLTFPRLLPTRDEPLVMEVVAGSGRPRVLYLARRQDPTTSKDQFFLRAIEPNADGSQWLPSKLDEKDEIAIDFAGKPSEVRGVDANGDGVTDLLFLFLFQPPELWLGKGTSFVAAPPSSKGGLGNVTASAVVSTPLNGKSALLVGQGNFVRSLQLGEDGRWRVLDQFNAPEPTAKVIGLAVIDFDGDGVDELALYDRAGQSLSFLKQQDGVYRSWRQMKVPGFALRGAQVGDFNHDGKKDLLLFDNDRMGICYTGKPDLELALLSNYETAIRKAKLFDMVPGDVNGDGRTDIVLVDPVEHHLEIVAVQDELKMRRAVAWQVFEEKTFRQRGGSIEPREVVVGDVDGDGRQDIVTLVHDRVLVYLQDTPAKAEAPAAGGDGSARSGP